MPWGAVAGAVVGSLLAPDPPETPDYAGAAKQQGQDNIYASQVQNQQNRVDTTTPYGSQTFQTVADPSVPGGYRYSSNISLSPEQQQLYDLQTKGQIGTSQIGNQMLDRVGQTYSTPFSFGAQTPGGQVSANSNFRDPNGNVFFEQARQTVGQGPQFQGAANRPSFSDYANPEMFRSGQTSVQGAGAYDMADPNGGPTFGRVNSQGPQARDLYGQQGYESSRKSVEDALMSRYERLRGDQMSSEGNALESKLKNMGLTEGTEAYDRELRNMRQSQSQERADWADRAILEGGTEQSRLAGLDLSADAQRFGQQQQGFQNDFTRTGFNNTADQQEYSNMLSALSQRNQARSAGGAEERAALGFNNDANRQDYSDFYTRGQDATRGNNANQQQTFTNEQTGRAFDNASAQQGFQNQVTGAGFNNQAYGEEYARYLSAMGYDENSAMQRTGFNNNVLQTDRQNSNQERLQERNMPLAEYNALRTGANPTMPGFQGYGQSSVQAAPTLAGAQAQGGANAASYNAEMGNYQNLFNLGAKTDWSKMTTPSWMQNMWSSGTGQPGGYTPDTLDYFYGSGG